MAEKTLEEMASDICCIIGSMGMVKTERGSPINDFQQDLLKAVQKWQESQKIKG